MFIHGGQINRNDDRVTLYVGIGENGYPSQIFNEGQQIDNLCNFLILSKEK